jgi:hypothetical protein
MDTIFQMPSDHNQAFKALLIQTVDKPFKYGDLVDYGKAFRHVLRYGVKPASRAGCEE